jgi:hypothetical protein
VTPCVRGPNDIEFSGERKRVRCNEVLGRCAPSTGGETGAASVRPKEWVVGEKAPVNAPPAYDVGMKLSGMVDVEAQPCRKGSRPQATYGLDCPERIVTHEHRVVA